MPDIIQLLPDAIANQIAAGEVIQRPASAVKEMLENAIDAGADNIQLIVKDAGRTLIQVIDNGCGMSATDARMSFERHATSKIRKIDDLYAIRTMGFRGEALASIAAVAQVELKSRKTEDELGTILEIEGSEVKRQEPCQANPGTSLSLKNLFYNVPARRNFLKSNPVETKHIIEEFQRVALAHPQLAFSLHHNGSPVFQLEKGNLRQRIVGVFGKNYNERVVPVEEETDIFKIHGFVGKPENARKTRGEQYFFVNNRFIKSAYLNHAVFKNYDAFIPEGSYPFFVLFIDIDPAKVDINVHPTKQEIKFEEEHIVYTFVKVAIQHALAKFSVTPTIDFDQEPSIDRQFGRPSSGSFEGPKQATTGWSAATVVDTPKQKSNLRNWEQLYDMDGEKQQEQVTLHSEWDGEDTTEAEVTTQVQSEPYQMHNKYIVSAIKSGFMLVDQQAAHERIMYERYRAALAHQKHDSQRLLFPQTIHVSATDAELLKEILPNINALGFDIQDFGQNSFVVHGLPSDIQDGNEQQMLELLLEDYQKHLSVENLNQRESLARSLAYRAAIKEGKKLQVSEMRQLIDELFACEQPYVSPAGKLTFTTFDFEELEKRFAT